MKKTSTRLLCLLLALVMAGLCACAPTAVETPQPTAAAQPVEGAARIFTTTGNGNNGAITVETTIDNGVITNVKVLEHAETAGICDAAIERIPQAIVKANSVAVDTVTGATNSSKGIIAAVEAAITEAGLDLEAYKTAAEKEEAQLETIETDILVIGAGASGLSAAIKATESGKKVTVIEKNSSVVSCATALSGGGFVGAASKLQKELGVTGDSAEQMYADLLAGGIDNIDYLLKLFSENCGKTVDWLYYDLKLPVAQKLGSSVEHSFDRSFSFEGGASAITSAMSEKLTELGGTLMLDTKAESLVAENGKVTGAMASGLGSNYQIKADRVILATGGYGANSELLPQSVSDVLYYGPACSTGDGLTMAMEIGADTVYLDHVKVYPQGIEIAPGKGAVSTGGSMNATAQQGAIYVNIEGKRVVNENASFVTIRDVTMLQTGRCIYLVMDKPAFDLWAEKTVAYKFMSQDQIDSALAQNGGVPLFAHADTIAEAAKIAGIDEAALTATVEGWNAVCDEGVDREFGNTMLNKIDEGPYYILEQKLRFASTLGGLVVDGEFKVLDTSGNAIEGLYAAGELVGGAHGKDSMPTCNVGWALTSGMLAGESAVK